MAERERTGEQDDTKHEKINCVEPSDHVSRDDDDGRGNTLNYNACVFGIWISSPLFSFLLLHSRALYIRSWDVHGNLWEG